MDSEGGATGQVGWPNGHGRILRALAEHGNVCRACRDLKIPRTRVYNWLDADPAYRVAFEDARAAGMRGMRDAAVDHVYRAIEEDAAPTPESLRTALRVLAQTDPERWAERSRMEHTGAGGGPITNRLEVRFVDAADGQCT